jgi:hypothetical protein
MGHVEDDGGCQLLHALVKTTKNGAMDRYALEKKADNCIPSFIFLFY